MTTPTLHRIDIRWQDGPTLTVWTDPETRWDYTLNPSEAYTLVRRLVGYLGALHHDRTDRTDATIEANPQHFQDPTIGTTHG